MDKFLSNPYRAPHRITWIFSILGLKQIMGFPDSSVGNKSACNAGDPGLIPGLGRSAGEGIGYPLQYSWAFLVAQLVKDLPAVQETWAWSLGREILRRRTNGNPLQYSCLVAHGQRSLGGYSPWDCRVSRDWHSWVIKYMSRWLKLCLFGVLIQQGEK